MNNDYETAIKKLEDKLMYNDETTLSKEEILSLLLYIFNLEQKSASNDFINYIQIRDKDRLFEEYKKLKILSVNRDARNSRQRVENKKLQEKLKRCKCLIDDIDQCLERKEFIIPVDKVPIYLKYSTIFEDIFQKIKELKEVL